MSSPGPEPYRVALYYAPAPADPLWQAGCAWLGRDAETGADIPQPDIPGLKENTVEPRRYGLHATLKAPLIPRRGLQPFLRDAAAFAARQSRFPLPPLEVTEMEGFLALCTTEPSLALRQLADGCLKVLDTHRAPQSPAVPGAPGERSARQLRNIARWGYPRVLQDFRFHMTLTDAGDARPWAQAAVDHFAPALALPRQVEDLAVFAEAAPGAPFRLLCRLAFGG